MTDCRRTNEEKNLKERTTGPSLIDTEVTRGIMSGSKFSIVKESDISLKHKQKDIKASDILGKPVSDKETK